MAIQKRRVNRGPAAAAQNRQAILHAARELFARHGYDVPLSAIAQQAGVSQGVMYRHFPRRVELALEVFEDNFTTMEIIRQENGSEAIYALWKWLLERAVHDAGFIETIRAARAEVPGYEGPTRLRAQLDVALADARAVGHDLGELKSEDLMRAWRMAYGLVATAREDEVTPRWLGEILSIDAVRRLFGR